MSQNKTREEERAWWTEHVGERGAHMLELDDEFPSVGMFEPWCLSASVGAGWRHILRPVLRVLAKYGCQTGQVKSKFCQLVVYWHHPDVRYADLPVELRLEVETVIAVASELSLHMCEGCGVPVSDGAGRPISGVRLCPTCRKGHRFW